MVSVRHLFFSQICRLSPKVNFIQLRLLIA